MSKILKVVQGNIKSIDDIKHIVEVIVSTENKDSDGDIILRTAFSKNLARYKSNPILINSHNYRDVENILGKAISIKVTDKGLLVKFEYFVGQGNKSADWAFQLAKNGIAAYSIGFVGLDYEYIKEPNKDGFECVTGRKFKEVELLEISQVTVPANKDAVLEARSIKSIEIELLDKVQKAFENKSIEQVAENKQPKKTEESNNIKSIYDEVLLGEEPEQKSSTAQKLQSKKTSHINGTYVKVKTSEIEKITKEILK